MKISLCNWSRCVTLAVFGLGLLPAFLQADVVPGEVIDRSNYQKIDGLVPDFIQNWVRDGDLILKIGEHRFDPRAFWPQEVKDNWQANIGRYRIDENNGMIDVKTGQPARGIKGLPFPEPDPNDPTMPVMLLWNDIYHEYFMTGSVKERQHWLSVGRGGLEKDLVVDNLTTTFDPTEYDLDFGQITVFREPFKVAGVGSMAVFSLYPMKDGIRFALVPELRRMKRLSHRVEGTQTFWGVCFAPDDSWAGGPKTNMEVGAYRLVGQREALVPYLLNMPRKVEYNDKHELDIGCVPTGLKARIGFEDPGWKGAPWHTLDLVWVKAKVWVIESRGKDPNYSYGPCEGWWEQGTFRHCYKRVTDRGGNLWKGVYWGNEAIETTDGSYRMTAEFTTVEVDIREDKGANIVGGYREGAWKKLFVKDMDKVLFTGPGFLRFSQ